MGKPMPSSPVLDRLLDSRMEMAPVPVLDRLLGSREMAPVLA